MHKVSRSLLLAGVMAFGTLTAACGDKVNIVQPTSTAPTGITAITVTPSSATIGIGATNAISLAVAVVADAATAKTVTWTTSSAAVATVDATGKVTGVTNGTVTITATATADPTKAAAAVITVAGGIINTVNTVAISAVTQLGVPVQLGNVAGQVDVTLFISGPGGTLNLIQNCTAGGATSTTGDVIVAQQQVAGSQNQSPVTLSFNTAATGAVTSGVAVPSATSSTPLYLNGNCVLKASLGTAVATNVTPITLNNVSQYRYVLSTSGASTISATNNLSYNTGDLTATITPVNYAGGSPLAFISGQLTDAGVFAGRAAPGAGAFTFTNVAPAAGTQTFTVTFPSAVVAAAVGAIPASNISQYTSSAAGDQLTVVSSTTAAGGNGFVNLTPSTAIRIDNAAPVAPTSATITNQFNWVNASYSFLAGVTGVTANSDVGGPATGVGGLTTVVGTAPASTAGLAANVLYGTAAGQGIGATACSQTGFTVPANPATMANSAPTNSTTYRARVFITDKLGNVRCQDLASAVGAPVNNGGLFGVDLQNPTAPTRLAGPTDQTTIASGATLTLNTVPDSISGENPVGQIQYQDYRNFSTAAAANCVQAAATPANGCTSSGSFALNIDAGSGTQAYYTVVAQAVDQAGNLSAPLTLTYVLDGTAPLVQGINIPQNLVGGSSVTFASTATDNVDLASTNFNIQYSAASGVNLFYTGDTYGTKFTLAGITKTAAVNATIPFFIQQVQATDAGGAPVALTAADSGEAQTINVRAVDAAKNVSVASVAGIPNINISSKAGYVAGTDLSTFSVTNGATALNNTAGAANGTRSTTLVAQAVLTAANAQTAVLPFSQVCFFYQQSAAGAVANPAIPAFTYVSAGCVNFPDITDVAGVSRTFTYRLSGFDPSADLGTAAAVNVIAIGVKSTGVGLASQANTNITVIP